MGKPPQNIEKQRQPYIAAPTILPLLTSVRQRAERFRMTSYVWRSIDKDRLGRVSIFGGPRECGGRVVHWMPSNDSETELDV